MHQPLKILGVALGGGVAVFLGVFLLPHLFGLSAAANTDPLGLVGKTAPEFALHTIDGQEVSLSELKGQVVLLDVWATWCPPCRESLPHLQKLSTDASLATQGLVVWALNDAEQPADVAAFLAANKYTFTVPLDDSAKTLEAYHVEVLPSTILIGRDGTIKATFTGFSDSQAHQIDAAITKALAQK